MPLPLGTEPDTLSDITPNVTDGRDFIGRSGETKLRIDPQASIFTCLGGGETDIVGIDFASSARARTFCVCDDGVNTIAVIVGAPASL